MPAPLYAPPSVLAELEQLSRVERRIAESIPETDRQHWLALGRLIGVDMAIAILKRP